MKNYKMPLILVLLLLVILFTLQNSEQVSINFLFWHVTLSRALVIFIFLAIGLVIGWVLGTLQQKNQQQNQQQGKLPEKKMDDDFSKPPL